MGKILLTLGLVASLLLAGVLWHRIERCDFKRADESGLVQPATLAPLATEKDIEKVVFLLQWVPREFVRNAAMAPVRGYALEIPLLETRLATFQWEESRDGRSRRFSDPPAWRFWGILGLIAAAPLILSCLVAGGLALASGKERKP